MAVKRDRVNRVRGIVSLPLQNIGLKPGDSITLAQLKEKLISTHNIDASLMTDPHMGNAIGDVVIDAAAPGECSVMDASLPTSLQVIVDHNGVPIITSRGEILLALEP